MLGKIQELQKEAEAFALTDPTEVENFRIRFLGRKGILNDLFEEFKTVPGPEKKEVGLALNALKNAVQSKIDESGSKKKSSKSLDSSFDFSRPSGVMPLGSRHPLALVRRDILDIFSRIGFTVADGPEIEDDWHVFSGLNFPPEHPARDMQDTFFH
jgi:phenylalanyl-tRNA synthetase alpha chain